LIVADSDSLFLIIITLIEKNKNIIADEMVGTGLGSEGQRDGPTSTCDNPSVTMVSALVVLI